MLIFLFFSCGESLNYKYNEQHQVINCSETNNLLINEALYSFESDLLAYHIARNIDEEQHYLYMAYASFAYPAAMNEIDFNSMLSNHTKEVILALRNEDDLWLVKSGQRELNYKSDLMTCLIDGINDEKLQSNLRSLISIDGMNSKLMADPYRVRIMRAMDNKEFAMFLALELFYQHTINLGE